eukprot:6531506-Prymnesium_polylepis.1
MRRARISRDREWKEVGARGEDTGQCPQAQPPHGTLLTLLFRVYLVRTARPSFKFQSAWQTPAPKSAKAKS